MSCIVNRHHNSKDYTSEEGSSKKSIEVGESRVIWNENIDGTEITGEIPFTDILSFQLSNPDDSDNQDVSILTISYIKSQNDSSLVNTKVTFHGKTQEITTRHEQIKNKMEDVLQSRPRKLLVFKNPYSGTGNAIGIFARLQPLFDEAGITCDEFVTTKAKDAEEQIQKFDLSKYDGVVVVGGDGLLSEVINGLARCTQNKAKINFNDHSLQHRPCDLPIGIIPAGTGNIYAKMFHGIREPITAALHIIRGFQRSSNLYSIHQDGNLCAYSILVFGFGFPGDLIKSSLSKKYFGRSKYFFALLQSLIWKHDAYRIKLSFHEGRSPEHQETIQNSENDSKTIEGEYHAIEGFSMDFKKTENSLVPAFGENYGKFVLVKKCSRLEHLGFYNLLNNQAPNAYDLSYIDSVDAKVCRIELLEPNLLLRRKLYLNYDGELLSITSNVVHIRLHHQIVSFFGS